MEPDESPEEEGPFFAYVHPDDRLWRHPSEVGAAPAGGSHTATLTRPLVRTPLTGRTWAVAMLAGVVGALMASGVLTVTGELGPRTTVLAPVTRVMTPNTLAAAAVSAVPGWAAVVDAVAPSVASVTAWSADGPHQGSAVVYGQDQDHDLTYVLTDADLVADAGTIDVTFNGSVAVPGHLMRADATSGVALLWVAGSSHLAPGLGTVDTLREADAVVTLGGRSGGDSAPVAGSVSGLDRTVVGQDSSTATCGMLAMSSDFPAGDDGGAVVDSRGAVVGIATTLVSQDPGDAGLSFAVPIDVAMHVAGQIIARQRVTHPWLGIDATSDLDTGTAHAMGLAGGAEVVEVAPGSPAAAAGLQVDDVVTDISDQPVTSSGSLLSQVAATSPGQFESLTYRRGQVNTTVRVKVAEQPSGLAG